MHDYDWWVVDHVFLYFCQYLMFTFPEFSNSNIINKIIYIIYNLRVQF